MNIRIVLALGKNGEIGGGNTLLWKLPKDLQHFRQITFGKPVIMGRKTFESIGRALPGRTNIVITRQENSSADSVIFTSSFEKALDLAAAEEPEEVCIIGGAEICTLALPYATHLSLTFIDGEFPEADTFFPQIDWGEWRVLAREKHAKDSEHKYGFEFTEYERPIRN